MDRCYRREYFHFLVLLGFTNLFPLSVARISSPGKGVN